MKNILYACIYLFIFLFLFLIICIITGEEESNADTNSKKCPCTSFINIKTIEGKVISIDPYGISDSDSADIISHFT